MAATFIPPNTIGELLHHLGDIPAERVIWSPRPGTAKERDLLRCLDHEHRLCELIDGALVEKPMGQIESSRAFWLGFYIGEYFDRNPIGQAYGTDGPFRLRRGNVRFPDVAFVSFDRIPAGPEAEKPIASWVPNLAVEVQSTSNTRREMQRKLQEYFDAGVILVWLVDPKRKIVRVVRDGKIAQKLTEQDTLDGNDVLPGFRLSLKSLFAKVERKPRK